MTPEQEKAALDRPRLLQRIGGKSWPVVQKAAVGALIGGGLAVMRAPGVRLGAGITPGALCCRSGSPPIPAEDC